MKRQLPLMLVVVAAVIVMIFYMRSRPKQEKPKPVPEPTATVEPVRTAPGARLVPNGLDLKVTLPEGKSARARHTFDIKALTNLDPRTVALVRTGDGRARAIESAKIDVEHGVVEWLATESGTYSIVAQPRSHAARLAIDRICLGRILPREVPRICKLILCPAFEKGGFQALDPQTLDSFNGFDDPRLPMVGGFGGGVCESCLDITHTIFPECYWIPHDFCPGTSTTTVSCSDGVQNGGEMGVDCGGPCRKDCPPGTPCTPATETQCDSDVCLNGTCQVAACADQHKNGDELFVDCGGSCPLKCPDGAPCIGDAGCTSGVCRQGLCVPATCEDNVKNGNEQQVDCAGAPCPLCPIDSPCSGDGQCQSTYCLNSVCKNPACNDGVKNDDETGVDCGGANLCPRCAAGQPCPNGASDCVPTAVCQAGQCTQNACQDGVKNGSESDVDCGVACSPLLCAVGKTCVASADCQTSVCSVDETGQSCRPASCGDNAQNGSETDLNCGGAACGWCASGQHCNVATDCASGQCNGFPLKVCQ